MLLKLQKVRDGVSCAKSWIRETNTVIFNRLYHICGCHKALDYYYHGASGSVLGDSLRFVVDELAL